jgi:hypothetical protein
MMAGIEKVKYDGVEVLDRVQGPRFNTFNKKQVCLNVTRRLGGTNSKVPHSYSPVPVNEKQEVGIRN